MYSWLIHQWWRNPIFRVLDGWHHTRELQTFPVLINFQLRRVCHGARVARLIRMARREVARRAHLAERKQAVTTNQLSPRAPKKITVLFGTTDGGETVPLSRHPTTRPTQRRAPVSRLELFYRFYPRMLLVHMKRVA